MIHCHLNYLVIIALKLAILLYANVKKSKESKWENAEFSLMILPPFFKNTRSFTQLEYLTNRFENISGLKLNEEKTGILASVGSLPHSQDLGIDEYKVNKPMKIFRIFFTYDWQKFQDLNSESIIKFMAMEKINV